MDLEPTCTWFGVGSVTVVLEISWRAVSTPLMVVTWVTTCCAPGVPATATTVVPLSRAGSSTGWSVGGMATVSVSVVTATRVTVIWVPSVTGVRQRRA